MAETLTPLGEGDPTMTVPQTAAELWAEFDPTAEPLDTEILYQWEESGVTLQVVRIRVGVFKGETVMVAGVYGFPTGQTNLPGLLNIHGGGQSADYKSCLYNALRGYATFSLAWAGRITADSPNDTGTGYSVTNANVAAFWTGDTNDPDYKVTTDWGPLEGYHAPSRYVSTNATDLQPATWTYDAVESPRNSTWFYWTMAARRALTFLENQSEVDGTRLGVYGHSMGGKLTVMTTGTDSRVKASAPSCGGNSFFDEYNNNDFMGVTIGDPAYLATIACPTMFLMPSNDFNAHIADMPASVAFLDNNSIDWRISTSAHHNHQDTSEYTVATQIWMDEIFKSGPTTPESPVISLNLNDPSGVPQITITADNTTRTVQSVEVFYTQMGEDDGEVQSINDFIVRHWHSATVTGSGANWAASLPIESTDEPLMVFANVRYDLDSSITAAGYYYAPYTAEQFVLSTPVILTSSAALQSAGVNATFSPTTDIEDFLGDWELEWFSYLEGATRWQRTTHKINDVVYKGPKYSKLSLEIYSEQVNKLVLRIDDAGVEIELPGGAEWQQVELNPWDFQKSDGVMGFNWDNANELELTNYLNLGNSVELGNAVWSGANPQFRNLQWKAGTVKDYTDEIPNPLSDLPVEDGVVYLTLESTLEYSEGVNGLSLNDEWLGEAAYEVEGQVYPRGITGLSPAELLFFLGRDYSQFDAITQARNFAGVGVTMQVYLDDVLAFESSSLVNDEHEAVSLDVSDAVEMRLVIVATEDPSAIVQAAWVDAKLTPKNRTIFSEGFEGLGGNVSGTDGWVNSFSDWSSSANNPSGSSMTGSFYGNFTGYYFDAATAPDPSNSGATHKPYDGTTDTYNLGQHWVSVGNSLATATYSFGMQADSGVTVEEGTTYELSFNYFKMPTVAQPGDSDVIAHLVDYSTLDATGGATTIFATQTFDAATVVGDIRTATLAFKGTAAASGAQLGILITAPADDLDYAGIDNVKLVANAAETFNDWGFESGLDDTAGKESGFDKDPDKDGLDNGVEAWFGTDPLVAGNTFTTVEVNSGNLSFQHMQNDVVLDGVNGSYEWSTNLGDWYAADGVDGPGGGSTVTVVPTTLNGVTTAAVSTSLAQEKIFIRVKVTSSN
ncbi:NPCBM/NEW2 domain-containing protein [Rubritalea marina]|uniref:NPCBM/NEW2 domain-containing protein n=1 Tax=Rubritalea marina TaxID=361055 RepID=UPI0003761512|nr:NPCBM/NEW2 domain-containing protein [Rubritalea marina]